MLDDADKYVLREHIAAMLDHPSVYMGGPSRGSVLRAIRIVKNLDGYNIEPGERAKADAERVRTWRLSPWDSLDRV